MDKARSVLVVSRDPRRQAELQEWLAPAGYEVSAADDFDTARRLLEVVAPDVLVADVKLGAYNGLHLAIWLRGRGLNTKAILIGQPDRVLQEEAARARAAYLSAPLDAAAFVTLVGTLSAAFTPARRSLRKRVSIGATVDGLFASIVDMSYEGLRLEVPHADAFTLPSFLTVRIPEHDLACRVKRVWLKRPSDPQGSLWCGATLTSSESQASVAWRGLVDAFSGWNVQAESAAR